MPFCALFGLAIQDLNMYEQLMNVILPYMFTHFQLQFKVSMVIAHGLLSLSTAPLNEWCSFWEKKLSF